MLLTDEEKAGLSEEEITAMEEGDGDDNPDDKKSDDATDDADKGTSSDADADDDKKATGDADKATDDDKGEGSDKDEEADKEGKKDKDKDESEDDKSADADEADKDKDDDKEAAEDKKGKEAEVLPEPKPFTPKFTEADQADLDSLKTAFDDAKKKFDDGEIDYTKFDEAKDAYNEAKWKADFAKESNQNMSEGRWQWEQERFLDDNKQYRDNKTLNVAFVATVNIIISTEEGKKLTDREVLVKAKEQVEADLGIVTPKPAAAAKTDKEKKEAIEAAKKANSDRSKIAADIGGLPAAEENEDVSDEFAYLDKLDGEAYQAAIDKLTPAQLQKYEDS